jgi:tetratricopeptide (TPR) repeat protein
LPIQGTTTNFFILPFFLDENHLSRAIKEKLTSVPMNRRECRPADQLTREATAGTGTAPPALCDVGINHMLVGRHLDAQLCAEQALAVDPGCADALHLMGLLCLRSEQYDHAVEWIGRAIRKSPRPDYLSNLGIALKQGGRLDEALQVFDKAVQLKPDAPEAWLRLAGVLVALGRKSEALLAYQHVLQLDRHHWEAAYQCGLLFHEAEWFEEAVSCFNRCDEWRPDHVPTLQARARALRGLKRFKECLTELMRADALAPADIVNCNNIGNALLGLDRPEEALRWFDQALALDPNSVEVLLNKASALGELCRFEEASEVYDHLQALDPENARCRFYRSHMQLLTEQFEAGWAGREARWKVSGLPIIHADFRQPVWLGNEEIAGKTLLVYSDEGLGDAIQFARYVPLVAARGARVILVIPDQLYPLMPQLPGVHECRPRSMGSPSAFDRYCPLTSLPLAFDTKLATIPRPVLLVPLAPNLIRAWEDRLGPRTRLRVGLVWSGNPRHSNDDRRSMPLRTMARLLDVDATFVSLQKDPRSDDKALLSERTDIIDLSAGLTDFLQTAALISCLDVVITVDTSVAHLAATLGRATWILLPYVPDWRWLLDRDDSPWYPTARLFRQGESRDYASVLKRVRVELEARTTAFRPEPPGRELC